MRSERSTDTEYLDETPWLDFGDTSLVSAMFQVTHNPAVLRAYGLTAPQTVELWMATPEHLENDASAKFRLHGEAFLLSATDNVKVVPYPGIYFLKLSSGAGTIKVTLQHTEMGRHSRKPNVVVTGGGGGGMTHEQNSDMALASGTANAVSAAELRAHLNTDKTYVHEQASAATTWTIPHNLGFKPDVALRTTGGAEFDGEVLHLSDNTLQVYLVLPTAGFARLT